MLARSEGAGQADETDIDKLRLMRGLAPKVAKTACPLFNVLTGLAPPFTAFANGPGCARNGTGLTVSNR